MFPLSDVLQHSHPDYMLYIFRKTNFIINPNKFSQIRWFWQHVLGHYDYQKFSKHLTPEEKEAFLHLLSSFCYSRSDRYNEQMSNIEKKSMWIFKHPMGGFYVPVEFIKILMNEKDLLNEGFLFSLLFKLRLKEQKNLTVLIKNNYDASQIITSEQNSWDMALVLYILFANFHTTGIYQRQLKSRPVLLPLHNREYRQNSYNQLLLDEATPMWAYLYSQFSHLHSALDEWQSLMTHGNKGFYRSLSLVSKPKVELVDLFSSGYFLPILKSNSKKIENIYLVTPTEITCGKDTTVMENGLRGLK